MSVLYQIFIAPIEAVMHIVLSSVHEITGSYGVSIFLLSLFINVILLPLFQIAERWQEAERRIQKMLRPKLEEFKQAFSGEERHVMIQTLYRQARYHPVYAMRSSFGLLLQLPFWIAAYQLLSHYEPLNGVAIWVFDDLGKPDRFLWGLNLLPFIMTGLSLAAAFVYTKNLSRTEQIQPLVLALVFLVLLYSAPAGLLLYWTFNSLFSLLRIALLSPALREDSASGGWTIATTPRIPSSENFENRVSGLERRHGAKPGRPAPSPGYGSRREIPILDLPLIHNFILFLVAIAGQMVVRMGSLVDEGGAFHGSKSATVLTTGASIAVLAYLCIGFSWKSYRGPRVGPRQIGRIVFVWLLFGAIVLVNVAWLSQAYSIPHAKLVLGLLILLFYLLFASSVCNAVPIIRNMPNTTSLYTVSISLTAFTVFMANPIGLYVSSSDFVGGIYDVVGTFLMCFVVALLVLMALYVRADKATRNGLALLSVFSAATVVGYSAIGVKQAGIMSHFRLPLPAALIRTSYEAVAEIAVLVLLFGATSYATIKYRRNVLYVLLAMLVASLFVAAADISRARDAVIMAGNQLPNDHADIISFSRERNVLIIMLDGFPGGYLQKIREEAPDALKEYEGFTWYPNTLAAAADTLAAIAALAGGASYSVPEINGRSYASLGGAIRESYGIYADAFIPKAYEVTYVNPAYAGGCSKLDNRIHCAASAPYGAYYRNKNEPDSPVLQGDTHIPFILTMVSLFKASPFFLKAYIYDNESYLGVNPKSVRFATANSIKAGDWGFLSVLARERNANSSSKTFKFIQVSIPHPPNALSNDCKLQPASSSIFTESVCALKEINVLLAWLKENRIYDNTKIVVVSDHGWYVDNPMFPPDFDNALANGVGWLPVSGVAHPLMLVKDFGARGDMSRRDTFLSNSDVSSIVCSAIGGCRGVGPDPTTNNIRERTHTFTLNTWPPEEENARRFEVIESYEVRATIFNASNWKRIK